MFCVVPLNVNRTVPVVDAGAVVASAKPLLVAEAECAIEVTSLMVNVAGEVVLVELMLTLEELELEATNDLLAPIVPRSASAAATL